MYKIELMLADRLAKRQIVQVEQDIAERQHLLGIPPIVGTLVITQQVHCISTGVIVIYYTRHRQGGNFGFWM